MEKEVLVFAKKITEDLEKNLDLLISAKENKNKEEFDQIKSKCLVLEEHLEKTIR